MTVSSSNSIAETSSIAELLVWASSQFVDSDSPRLDAELLLAFALKKDRTYLFTWPEKTLSGDQFLCFQESVTRRIQGEPVAYLMGEQGFWSLTLNVNPSTLIPRPETELLVEIALEKVSSTDANVLDLGTGTGAIALALASEHPAWSVTGVDFSSEAVTLAQENKTRCGLTNAEFLQSNWFDSLDDHRRFDLIVSNPPYIDPEDIHLSQGDVRFEPKSALISQQKGLADIVTIATNAREFLAPGGWLMFEHGYDQGNDCLQLLQTLGYQQVETRQDLGDRDRVTLGRFR